MAETTKRTQRRKLTGIVTRDKNDKTRRVEISRLTKHARYGKYIKTRTIVYVHDEKNESHKGDTVEIAESRPMSATKRFRLVRVVKKAPEEAGTTATPN
jgi:small subunit ribosomal protein S17